MSYLEWQWFETVREGSDGCIAGFPVFCRCMFYQLSLRYVFCTYLQKKSVLGNHSLCRYRYISTSCESASISLFVLFIGILMCVWMSGQGDVCVCVCVGMNKHAETMDTNTWISVYNLEVRVAVHIRWTRVTRATILLFPRVDCLCMYNVHTKHNMRKEGEGGEP